MYEICKSLGDPAFLPCHYLHPASRIASPPHNSISSVIRLPCPQSTLSVDPTHPLVREKKTFLSLRLWLWAHSSFLILAPRYLSLGNRILPVCTYVTFSHIAHVFIDTRSFPFLPVDSLSLLSRNAEFLPQPINLAILKVSIITSRLLVELLLTRNESLVSFCGMDACKIQFRDHCLSNFFLLFCLPDRLLLFANGLDTVCATRRLSWVAVI